MFYVICVFRALGVEKRIISRHLNVEEAKKASYNKSSTNKEMSAKTAKEIPEIKFRKTRSVKR